VSQDALYRRVDALLEIRARDHPLRIEPAWSELLSAVDELAARLREDVELEGPGPLPALYDDPVFVVGHRKTGTTLLLELLDGHPDLVVLPGESNHFLTFLPQFGGLPPEALAVEAQRWWLLRLVSPSGIPPFWAAGPWPDPYRAFTRRLLALVPAYPDRDPLGLAAVALAGNGGAAWVEKTPGQEHIVDEMLQRYPQARFLHVVRDPRSVAAAVSRLDAQTGEETDLVALGLTIRRSFEAAAENAERLGPGRYLVVRYEDLVAGPEPAMRRVADFLGLEWSPTLLVPTVGGVAATSNSAWSDRKVTGEIEGRRLDLWREQLGDSAASLIGAATRGPARAYGYELPSPGLRESANVAARRARVAVAQFRSRGTPSPPVPARKS
jgi:sulfotransferase family protein